MSIQTTIADIKTSLIDTFSTIDNWFDKNTELCNYKPVDNGWTINEILEHIGLVNHFLIILIDKGTDKALRNINNLDLQAELKNYEFHWDKFEKVGTHKSFSWNRPDHTKPTGEKPIEEVRKQLKDQLSHCLDNLDRLENGEGVLYKTMLTVNNLGKIDVYEYIYFLAQHGRRHITQMQKNEAEYESI